MYQLHDGMPSHDGARVKEATIFESSTAIIAPLTSPSQDAKHPVATRLAVETPACAGSVSGGDKVSTGRRGERLPQCPLSAEE
jgi:hypothetical protein